MFKAGDAVFHPMYGAGIVTEIKERRSLGKKRYYSIRLCAQPKTVVMVPVQSADEVGLRRSIQSCQLEQVWKVLRGIPRTLPDDHDERYALIKEHLHCGDTFKIATALRDMASLQRSERGLTRQDERLYEEGTELLAGELAVAQGLEFDAVERQLSRVLREEVHPAAAG